MSPGQALGDAPEAGPDGDGDDDGDLRPTVAGFCCRSCGSKDTARFLDLGLMPPSDAILTADQLAQPERRYPLEVALCRSCALVQITETVPPEELFSPRYAYYSSFSDTLLEHSRSNAVGLIASRRLGPQSLVVELASNDGYLLQFYKQREIPVLGVDPAPGQARAANERGIPTRCAFFGEALAREMHGDGVAADVVHANNVLAHVADTNGFVAGIARLLKDGGVAVLELPYVRDLVEHCEFDTIYHEHLCYFSVTALVPLFERHGLHVNHVEHLAIHGGSLRIFAGKRREPEASVGDYLARERREGMDRLAYFTTFAARVEGVRRELARIAREIQGRGQRIAAYGAAAKGTILLNYAGLGSDDVDFVVDRNVHKHGKYMPGVRVPILPVEELLARQPEYTLLLPWNFKEEILRQQAEYRSRGGKFIVPIPFPEVV